MNSRIKRLRQRFVNAERHIDVERALIVTESYQKNEDKPPIVKRALALKDILQKMTVVIREDELIVGNHTKNVRGVPLFPEYAVKWILNQMDTFPTRKGDQFQITEDQKKVLKETLPYWQGRSMRDKIKGSLSPELKEVLDYGIFTNENFTMSGPGHIVPDYYLVMDKGLKGVKADCEQKLADLDPLDSDYEEKYNFYLACTIVSEALMEFAGRYAREAERLAAEESEEVRRQELEQIAANCRRVPADPVTNFWEALQCLYFLQLTIQIEANGLAIALGRPDQELYPYYQQDLSLGNLSKEKAQELIESLYLKLNELDKIYTNEATRFLQGPGHGQTITLGGITEDGRDATNELSYLFLEADLDIRLVQPDIAVRIHRTTPEALIRQAAINVREGLTKPKFFNDEVVIQSLLNIDIPLVDARDWGALGCSEPVICGKTNSWGDSGHLNLTKCLELALNNGKCMLTGKQMGPETGELEDFADFTELFAAFKKQVQYFVKYLVLYDNIIDHYHAQETPLTLYSILTRDCLETGIEFNKGGARYNTTSPLGVGPITTGDSLAAIKTLVYEEELISKEELKDLLINNFAGREDLRNMLINRAPKFGNDEDQADELANEVLKVYCDDLRNYKNPRNGPFIGALYYLSANIPFGLQAAASADGRKSGEPLNDGGISPVHGRDRKGATAVAKSVGKLDLQRVPHGAILNQRFHPSLIAGDDKLKLFGQYIRTFMDLGGWHTQFNVVSSDVLQEAKEIPEKYKDLVIRVAGYSAYFTQLEEELQDDIIARTEKMAF